jgi:hypothetical protein
MTEITNPDRLYSRSEILSTPCPAPTADTLFTANCGSFVKKPMKLRGSWKLLATKRQVEDEV